MMPIVNMMLGEVAPGGVGSGLYGMLVLAVITVFVAGLMVGRTPEYLGKKIGAREIKLASLYFLVTPTLVLVGTAAAFATGNNATALNVGPHGLSEVLYAFTSAGNNNGSAFAGHHRQHRRGGTPRSGWRCCSAGSCRSSSCSALAGSLARAEADPGVRRARCRPTSRCSSGWSSASPSSSSR